MGRGNSADALLYGPSRAPAHRPLPSRALIDLDGLELTTLLYACLDQLNRDDHSNLDYTKELLEMLGYRYGSEERAEAIETRLKLRQRCHRFASDPAGYPLGQRRWPIEILADCDRALNVLSDSWEKLRLTPAGNHYERLIKRLLLLG